MGVRGGCPPCLQTAAAEACGVEVTEKEQWSPPPPDKVPETDHDYE
jgi:hypothetical protein